jgi:hypothetical protein
VKREGPIFILLFSALLSSAAEEGFSRYQPIIDKQPFGQEPLEADALQTVSSTQSFARNLRLSMLLEGSDGSIRAGIIDSNLKKSYILRIGEPQDGLELVEADMDSSEALLRKGNEVVLFKLESGDGEQMARSQPSSQQNSYAERRRALLRKIEERRKQQAEEKPPEPKLTGDALKKHLEDVQMDAIRSGRPPLPMPLTPEMDAQLVSEGVLPPQ